MRKNKFFILFVIAICNGVYGQLTVSNLHYIDRIVDGAYYFQDNQKIHSAVLPALKTTSIEKVGGFLFSGKKNNIFSVYPIADIMLGVEGGPNSKNPFLYDAGFGLGLDWSSEKFFFTGKFLPYISNSPFLRDSTQNNLQIDPGGGTLLSEGLFQQNEITLSYRPNRFFTFTAGQGRNFFGEGYRSLILSDNASPNPFFKIETSFSSIKYVNLYNIWKDNTIDPSNHSFDKKKFSAMHYISWNITREFNLSIFESVVWQAKDTLIDRGFDPNYLNPVVFYRPVEYGNGSADNVLLGANMSFKFDKNRSIYTQLILDDFLLAEIRARSRWWANKYGFQFGYKSLHFLNLKNLYFQAEFNTVRPFTYSHKFSTQSYGHLNASVAHPIGANFYELTNILSYNFNKFRITNKLTYSGYGVDSSTVSYGQNIFASYDNRDGEYDHYIMQGLKKNVLNETLIIEMPLYKKMDIYFNLTYNWRFEVTASNRQHNHYIKAGIRSRIWNRYSDY